MSFAFAKSTRLNCAYHECCALSRWFPLALSGAYARVLCAFALVGPSGLEPPTSCLSGTRSNLLSYDPLWLVCDSHTWLGDDGDSSSIRFAKTANIAFAILNPWVLLQSVIFITGQKSPNLFVTFCPVVEMMGFEPMTPCLQGRCSPS